MAVLSMAIRFISGPMIVTATSFAVELRGARLRTAIVQVYSHTSPVMEIEIRVDPTPSTCMT